MHIIFHLIFNPPYFAFQGGRQLRVPKIWNRITELYYVKFQGGAWNDMLDTNENCCFVLGYAEPKMCDNQQETIMESLFSSQKINKWRKKEKNLRRTKEDEGRIPGKRSTVGEPGGQKPIVR